MMCQLQCSDPTWDAWLGLVSLVTETPVVYGPGRGLFVDGKWVITWGPGKLGSKGWKGKGLKGPSFHCSSWTNFVLGFLTCRDREYTHSGNVPHLQDLLDKDDSLHKQDGVASYRGYGANTSDLLGAKVVTLADIYLSRKELPTFICVAQSTKKKDGGWKWWHHTVIFVVDHRQEGSPLYRIAADGYKSKKSGYSCQPMKYTEITEAKARADVGKHIYQGSLIHPEGIPAPVVLEA